MATTIQQIHPVAHLPLVLGVLRHLEVATVIDRLIPPHPAHGLSCGRGVEALVLAILDGHHALYKVGRRLEERGMVTLLQPGLTRIALNDYRLGHILEALFAANLNKVYGAIALKALEVYALPTPWLHQDTTTIALYGAYADEPKSPEAPHPAYGHSKDGRDDLKQVLLSLGVSGDGGIPLRLGLRDGNRSDSVETPVAIEECLALGLEGVHGIVADSKAYSRRTLGLCLEHGIGLVTLVPRTCAIRQDLEAWGRQHPALPLLVEKPGRTKDEEPRRWHGHSVLRRVEVEYSEGRVAQETVRFVVVHSSQLAQQHAQTYASAQAKEAEAVADHVRQVQAQWFACLPDAEAAIAAYEGQGPGRRGRRPRPWRYHTLRYSIVAASRRTRRPRRGRPAKTDPPPTEAGYGLMVEVDALPNAEGDNGWTVLATTVRVERCTDTEILEAYQEQNTTVEPGFRWIKNPAAIAPVWLEKPERIAALAMLTVVGLLVYSLIQRQVRLYLRAHDQQLPGNKGLTATPTAAVVLALFAQVALIQLGIDDQQIEQLYGVQPHHLLLCDALGLNHSWYEAPSAQKNGTDIQTP
ncbi:MAG: IS1634 family transposase [Acidobacteria bacterium Pan2503]|uniref:IS1634 family transposase n=1 Tax=Candidatus Acidiferrum panamense TaxID=2741543 RepID=A0A7V8NX92_9BACT|nr:IS1634 family transposase [Candidatus Acidoferrum panamensis]